MSIENTKKRNEVIQSSLYVNLNVNGGLGVDFIEC